MGNSMRGNALYSLSTSPFNLICKGEVLAFRLLQGFHVDLDPFTNSPQSSTPSPPLERDTSNSISLPSLA
jgi:hypothetical protein